MDGNTEVSSAALSEDEQKGTESSLNWLQELGICPVGLPSDISTYGLPRWLQW